jgi:hypothetical protein
VREPSPRDAEPWNREPPMAGCSICDEVSCSTCRQQSRCSNCLQGYCASCCSMKICSECDRQFCANCTRSKFLKCLSVFVFFINTTISVYIYIYIYIYTHVYEALTTHLPLPLLKCLPSQIHEVSSCGACGDQYCANSGCENSHFKHCVSSSFRRSAFN